MQRLLTVLVLVLLVAVAALGIAVYKLPDATAHRQPTSVRPSVPDHDPEAAAREAEFERKIAQLEGQVASLAKELRERPAAPRNPVESGGGGTGEGGFGIAPSPGLRARDANGQLVITEEDIELFQKIQEKVLRQQRVDSQARSAMLRVDRMIQRGDVAPLIPEHKTQVEKILRNVISSGDDLTQKLLRSPDEEVRGLTGEQRRDELTQARTQLLAAAQQELEPIVGADDAKKIAEESLQRPWGLGRPGRRFEDTR